MNVSDGTKSDNNPNRLKSLPMTVLLLVVGMSIFAYVRLSPNKSVIPVAILLLSILEALRLIQAFKESKKVEALSEAAYFIVLLSVFLGVYRSSLADHRMFMFATIFYRPNYTLYCNRRIALILGFLIMCSVLPITCGLVTKPDVVGLLSGLYALIVSALWALCSKPAAKVFGFEENS